MTILEDVQIPIQESKQPKQLRPYAFQPGNTAGVGIGRKGKQVATIGKQLVNSVEDKKAFKHKFNTIGLTRLWLCMEHMHDFDFVKCAIAVLPYCMPKVASVEDRDTGKEIHDITDLQQTHTITIRDMRTGMQTTIIDE